MLVDGNVDRVDATHIYVADCEYCTNHMDICNVSQYQYPLYTDNEGML